MPRAGALAVPECPGRCHSDVEALEESFGRPFLRPGTIDSVEEHLGLAVSRFGEVPGRDAKLVLEAFTRGQVAAQRVQRPGTGFALTGILHLFPNTGGELAHAQRHREHHAEGEVVGRVLDVEGVVRRDKEEIEGGDAEQRCEESRPPPIAIAHHNHREQEQHRHVDDLQIPAE